MRLLLKRFAAVLTAVLILFSFSVTSLSLSAAEAFYKLSDFYYFSSSGTYFFDYLSSCLNETYNDNYIVYCYRGASGSTFYGSFNLSLCSSLETSDYIYYCTLKDGVSCLRFDSLSLYGSSFDFSSLNGYKSSSDSHSSASFTFRISKFDPNDISLFYTSFDNYSYYNFDLDYMYSVVSSSNWNSSGAVFHADLIFACILKTFINPEPVPSPPSVDSSDRILYGVNVNINDKEGFIQWLKNEGKISLINSPGYNFTEKQIDLIVDVFDQYGNNPVMFMASLMKTFNIITSMRAASALILTIQQLYSDYQQYLHTVKLEEIKPSGAANPHWRTDKDNTTLVTDQDDDTSLISILREILRTLIYLPDNIAANLSYLQTYMNDFLYDFQRQIYLLDNLPGDTESSFRTDIDAILNAIKNQSGGGSGDISVDVTISDERQKEIDDFFSDWNLQYSDKINEKLPVLNQLSELFDDEFFEKCGIDVNEDGEVYEYYRPELATLAAEPVPDKNQQLLNDFVGQFDDADPDFLNNVSFTSDVPDFSISMNGVKHSIFNFNLYAKYRAAIHSIIIFVTYTLYFLSLYKSLPGIIGNVSDVAHVFSDRG